MLDEKDLQAIAELLRIEIAASDKRTSEAIRSLEVRTNERFDVSEEKTKREIHESEERTRRYFNELVENIVRKDIGAVADGIKTLNDRLPNVDNIFELQDRVSVLETSEKAQNKAIRELQKVQ